MTADCTRCGGIGWVVDARRATLGRQIPCPTCRADEVVAPPRRDEPTITHEGLVARLTEIEARLRAIEAVQRRGAKVSHG